MWLFLIFSTFVKKPRLDAGDKRSDLVQWENLEGAGGEGGGRGIEMGNACKPKAVSFQCMTKSTTNKKIKINKKIKRRRLYKLNCLQILKTTNKISVGEEIYFLVLDKKHLEKHEMWSPHSHSKKGGGAKKKPPNPPHIFLIQMRG